MGNWNQGPPNYGGPPMQPYYPPQPPPMQQNIVIMGPQPTMYVVKAPFNHTIHIVLDILTCGGWIFIHLICWACH